MTETRKIRILTQCAGLVLLGLAAFFIGRIVVQHWAELSSGPQYFNGYYFFTGIALLEIYWLYQIALWRWVLSGMGTHVDYLTASTLLFSNNLLAYIPGKVANAIGMVRLAKRNSISTMNTVTTAILFQIYSLISGTGLLGILCISLPKKLSKAVPVEWFFITGTASIIGLLLISPMCLRWSVALLRRISGRNIGEVNLPFSRVLVHVILLGFGWCIVGIAVWFLFSSFCSKEQDLPLTVAMVILIASYLIGLVVLVVPAGIGITEAGMVYGLGMLIEPQQALFGAASFRLATLGTTVASWVAVLLLRLKYARD